MSVFLSLFAVFGVCLWAFFCYVYPGLFELLLQNDLTGVFCVVCWQL